MGNNLSSTFIPDTTLDVLSALDAHADMLLGIIWGIAIYAFAMIFSTFALVDRWKGPSDRNKTGLGSVLAAFVLSSAWPVVLVYLFLNR